MSRQWAITILNKLMAEEKQSFQIQRNVAVYFNEYLQKRGITAIKTSRWNQAKQEHKWTIRIKSLDVTVSTTHKDKRVARNNTMEMVLIQLETLSIPAITKLTKHLPDFLPTPRSDILKNCDVMIHTSEEYIKHLYAQMKAHPEECHVGLDTEFTQHRELVCVQICVRKLDGTDIIFVVDPVNVSYFKEMLEDPSISIYITDNNPDLSRCIDVTQLASVGIQLTNIRNLQFHQDVRRQWPNGVSLGNLSQHYLDITLDKKEQCQFNERFDRMTIEMINYAAIDAEITLRLGKELSENGW